MMYCSSCGAENLEVAKFCAVCGASLGNNPNNWYFLSQGKIFGPYKKEEIVSEYLYQNWTEDTCLKQGENGQWVNAAEAIRSLPEFETLKASQKKQGSKFKTVLISVLATLLILFAVFTIWQFITVSSIKNGTLEDWPDQKIGECFENFFGDCKWVAYWDGEHRGVMFSGTCLYRDEETQFNIWFLYNEDGGFYISSAKLGDKNVSNSLILTSLLNKVYDD